jgi:hypothetical protein
LTIRGAPFASNSSLAAGVVVGSRESSGTAQAKDRKIAPDSAEHTHPAAHFGIPITFKSMGDLTKADFSARVIVLVSHESRVAVKAARRWWEKRSDESVGLCLLTRTAVLRLLTDRVAMNGHQQHQRLR